MSNKKKYVNLRKGYMIPYMRTSTFPKDGKTVVMLQVWDQDTQQWRDMRPLRVLEDGTVVHSEPKERAE